MPHTPLSEDERYMRRALQLAACGAGFASPNPMVGAVIVAPGGRIIGEGWHRCYGGPHAEVNAMRSVSETDMALIPESTIYVTLEPCSHYGKTPPCSLMLIERRIKRVVVGSPDPFRLVAGRGIRMLRDAGIEVSENVLREECDRLNRRFITAHTLHRPWIQLKWAQSSDGFIAAFDNDGNPEPAALSDTLTLTLMHRQRSMADAVMAGTNTVIIDNPSLSLRHWPGHQPRPVSFDSPRIPPKAAVRRDDLILLPPCKPLADNIASLYSDHNIISLMVEGGADTLRRFIESGLYDEIRVEISPVILHEGIKAPELKTGNISRITRIRNHSIICLHNPGGECRHSLC